MEWVSDSIESSDSSHPMTRWAECDHGVCSQQGMLGNVHAPERGTQVLGGTGGQKRARHLEQQGFEQCRLRLQARWQHHMLIELSHGLQPHLWECEAL